MTTHSTPTAGTETVTTVERLILGTDTDKQMVTLHDGNNSYLFLRFFDSGIARLTDPQGLPLNHGTRIGNDFDKQATRHELRQYAKLTGMSVEAFLGSIEAHLDNAG